MDNYYSTAYLARNLKHDTYCVGTLSHNRRNLPDDRGEKNLKRGNFCPASGPVIVMKWLEY